MATTILYKLQQFKYRDILLQKTLMSVCTYLNESQIQIILENINLNYEGHIYNLPCHFPEKSNNSYDIIVYNDKQFSIYSHYNKKYTLITDNEIIYNNQIFKYNFSF